ncbi:MAG: MFS transporter [Ktedonobacteraceae bacterium]|nr:MFS transporter [Ktedonobacteraceae bacterium]
MSFFWRFVPSHDLLRIPLLRWLVITRFFGDLFFYSTTLVLFQQQRGLNFTEMFFMEAILSSSILLADVPTSIWAERIGYSKMILIGRTIGLAGMCFFVSAHGFWMFALAEILGGIAIASTSGCESALIYAPLSPQQRNSQGSDAFALLSSASSAGFFLGLLTGSFLGAYSPTLAVAASLLPALLAFFSSLRVHHYDSAATAQEQKEMARINQVVRIAWNTVCTQPTLALLSLFRWVAFAITNAIFWYNQPYFQKAGIPIAFFGPLMAAAMGLQLLLVLRTTTFQKILGTRFSLMCSCLVPGLCYMLLTWLHTPLLTIVLVAGVVCFSAWQQPIVEQELNRRISDGSRATTLSALSLIGMLGKSVLDPVIGHLGDVGLDMVSMGLGGMLLLLSIVALFLIPQSKKHTPLPPDQATSIDKT